jgi:hypothetical protein
MWLDEGHTLEIPALKRLWQDFEFSISLGYN